MIIGVDTLAGIKYPEVIKQLNNKYATGYFWREFGKAEKQIEADAKSGRIVIRVQGLWAGPSHDYSDKDRGTSVNIAKKLNAIAAKNPSCRILYSPFCEHKKNKLYMTSLLSEIRAKCPNIEPVNSPISGGEWVDGFINEIHHNDKPKGMPKGRYIYSMDGLHQPDCNIEIYKARHLKDPNCIMFFVWALQHNCKTNAKDKTPALQRNCKPTHDLNMSLIFQIENQKQKVKLAAGWISKTHSEQHKDVDPRANKLTFVGPKGKSFKSVEVGKYDLVDSGFTEDKRHVWRSPLWAYKAGRVERVLANGKSVGTVDLPFRENEWREKT